MADESPIELDPATRDAFLSTGGTGVLSLSTSGETPPHSVPVSYGYDDDEETFYFRLAVGPESEKGDLADRPVSFVTYGEREGRWHSVVAEGRLEPVAEAEASETLPGLARVDIPLVDAFADPTRTVTFAFFRLEPSALTARTEAPASE
ncbi:MAG: pyridoxamine 5'-phosphate oxidase family protein [Haloarculaceae archaeon]